MEEVLPLLQILLLSFFHSRPLFLSLFSNKSTSFLFGESLLCSPRVPLLHLPSLYFPVQLPVLAPEAPNGPFTLF